MLVQVSQRLSFAHFVPICPVVCVVCADLLALVHRVGDLEQALVVVAALLKIVDLVDERVHVVLGHVDDARLLDWHLDTTLACRAWSCEGRPCTA